MLVANIKKQLKSKIYYFKTNPSGKTEVREKSRVNVSKLSQEFLLRLFVRQLGVRLVEVLLPDFRPHSVILPSVSDVVVIVIVMVVMVVVVVMVAIARVVEVLLSVARDDPATHLTLSARRLRNDTSSDYGVVLVQGNIRNFEI